MSEKQSQDDKYLWNRSGDRHRDIDKLVGSLASLRAPAQRVGPRRWWLAPAVMGVIGCALAIALARPERLPVQIVGLVSGETGATPMMIGGGTRVELSVVSEAVSRQQTAQLASRVRAAGFDVVFETETSIIANQAGTRRSFAEFAPMNHAVWQLGNAGLVRPFTLAFVADTDLPEYADLHAAADSLALVIEDGIVRGAAGEARRVTLKKFDTLARSGFALYRERGAPRAYVAGSDPIRDLDILGVRSEEREDEIILSQRARRLLASLDDETRLLIVLVGSSSADSIVGVNSVKKLGTLRSPRGLKLPRRELLTSGAQIHFQNYRPGELLAIKSATFVQPTIPGHRTWLARILFGFVVGSLVFAIVAIVCRRVRSADPVVDRTGRGERARLVLSTLLGAMIAACAVVAPRTPFGQVRLSTTDSIIDTNMFALGLVILAGGALSAFIASLLRSAWRPDLRIDISGSFARRVRLCAVVAAAAAILVAVFDEQLNFLTSRPPLLETIAYAGASATGVAMLALVGRWALGGPRVSLIFGFLAFTAAVSAFDLRELQWELGFGGGSLLTVVVAAAFIASLTWRTLSVRSGPAASSVSALLGGVLPLLIAINCFAVLVAPELRRHADGAQFWLALGFMAAVALPAALVLARLELGALRGLSSARVLKADRRDGGEWRSMGISLGFVLVVVVLESVGYAWGLAIFVPGTILLTACALDLIGEFRARWRKPNLVVAFSMHRTQLASLVAHALDNQGIDVHLRGHNLRRCLGVLGAFVPIGAMVERQQAGEAREIAASLLDAQPAGLVAADDAGAENVEDANG